MTCYSTTFTSAFGPFSVAVDAAGAVVGTAFGDADRLRSRLGLADAVAEPSRTAAAVHQLSEYFAGLRRHFTLRLAPAGSPYQQRVWAELARIPYGETRSYGDLARVLQSSPRAVGRANATNPLCVIVPCHRVVGADGSLTGFAFGEVTKHRLLTLEGADVVRSSQLVLGRG